MKNINYPVERIALGIEYDGTSFHGWQRQPHAASVQETLESTLSTVANHRVDVICAGRTDTGVHATAQVVHFNCQSKRLAKAWLKGANSLLPSAISIRFVQPVDTTFHARFSALSRSYCYIIDNSSVRPGIMNAGLTWYRQELDVSKMNDACDYFVGEQDFSSFRSSQCQSHTANRFITSLQCQRINNYVVIKVTANAFLHHMVRNIVGVLLEIGDGRRPYHWAQEVLQATDRTKAGVTASPKGLYLVGVSYPKEYKLPHKPRLPLFLNG